VSQFRDYLTKQSVSFTEADWTENLTWIKQQLKREMYATGVSFEESQKVAVETDPIVIKGIEAIPEARALLDKSKKLIVQRTMRDGQGQP
jgi:hypothetical protein